MAQLHNNITLTHRTYHSDLSTQAADMDAARQRGDLERVIDHVFLPPRLPQSRDDVSDKALITITMSALAAFQALCPKQLDDPAGAPLARATSAIHSLARINSLGRGLIDGEQLLTTLTSLKAGQTLATRITAQNAGVLVTKHEDALVFEQFELSPTNKAVIGTHGCLKAASLPHVVHEHFLPANAAEAKTVVFELDPPAWFTYWRAARQFLLRDVLGGQRPEAKLRASYILSDNDPHLTRYSKNLGTAQVVLLSQTKPNVSTHYRSKQIAYLRLDQVCVKNGLQYQYWEPRPANFVGRFSYDETIPQRCTYRANRAPLQPFLFRPASQSDGVGPNVAIATQHACPNDMVLEEYKDLATMPLGRYVQWTNLLSQLVMPTIDFKKSDTTLFVMQCIYQAGPPDSTIRRQSHVELANDTFAYQVLDALATALDRIKGNWESAQALSALVAIATRVLSLATSPTTHAGCLAFLKAARNVAKSWIDVLQQTASDTVDHAARGLLIVRGVEIALICASTLDIDELSLSAVLRNSAAAADLTYCSILIQDGVAAATAAGEYYIKLLQWRVKRVLFRAYDTLAQHQEGLTRAVKKYWAGYTPDGTGWHAVSGVPEWAMSVTAGTTSLPSQVHLNCLTGALLVNGQPLARPPKVITDATLFDTLFGPITLEVMPSSTPGFQCSTKRSFSGHAVQLGMSTSVPGELLVQTLKSGVMCETVPSRLFANVFPDHFVSQYVHWYNAQTQQVEFRPIAQAWVKDASTVWLLVRDPEDGKWILTKDRQTVAYNSSATSKRIANVLKPLATVGMIHNILDRDGVLQIDVPGLRLSFALEPRTATLRSKEHPNTVVDEDQFIGVLISLQNKLVLKPLYEGRRVLLIPEGSLVHASDMMHVRVSVTLSANMKLRALQIDTELGRIMDNGDLDCKLYLAISTPLHRPASLISLRASQARKLRSAGRLSLIAAITPHRCFYPPEKREMQVVIWDKQLGFMAQHNGFRFAVKTLFRQSEDASIFYPDVALQLPTLHNTNEDMLTRDDIRSATFRIAGFGAELHTTFWDRPYAARDIRLSSMKAADVTSIAALVFEDEPQAHWPSLPSESLWSAVSKVSMVHGPQIEIDSKTLKYNALHITSGLPFVLERLSALQRCFSSAAYYIEHRASLAMCFATIAFDKAADVQLLQTIVLGTRPDLSSSVHAPDIDAFSPQAGKTVEPMSLSNIVATCRVDFGSCPEYNLPRHANEKVQAYYNRRQRAWDDASVLPKKLFTDAIFGQWPCEVPFTPHLPHSNVHVYLKVSSAMPTILQKFKTWHDNRALFAFTKQIESAAAIELSEDTICPAIRLHAQSFDSIEGYTTLDQIFSMDAPQLPTQVRDVQPLLLPQPMDIDSDDAESSEGHSKLLALIARLKATVGQSKYGQGYIVKLQQSAASLQGQHLLHSAPPPTDANVLLYLVQCKTDVEQIYLALSSAVSSSVPGTSITSQQWPRIHPILFLQQLACERWFSLSPEWKQCVVAYGVALTALQQAQRLSKFALSSRDADVMAELQTLGQSNWDPMQHPKTLLMEAESGFLVRRVQHDIASEMRTPQCGQNAVMQLNMGEGKSSVITPMVAASFATGEQLSRVFVAKPQSKQMAQMLIAKLGGLLNRRVYYMPFSRSLQLNRAGAERVAEMLKDCMLSGGVLLVQPEHVLSLKLMALECYITGKEKTGECIMTTLDFLDSHCRDLVDESDENYSVRFELIYTMGMQNMIDLSPNRWLLTHEVLQVVSNIASYVALRLPSSIEVTPGVQGSFPRIRLLRPDAEELLLHRLAESICEDGIAGLRVSRQPAAVRHQIYTFITKQALTTAEIEAVTKGPYWSESTKLPLLLARGLIAEGVLAFTLSQKRWRVQYGLTSRTPITQLAVPYRAKDSPTPRSEFSHPDVVIILTSLSYYYGGLTDDDMFAAMSYLLESDQSDVEYQSWVEHSNHLNPAFRDLQGVNLKDRHQCVTKLFPALRHGKSVIDFFLSRVVFPKEMKEFPSKLSLSGWEIGKKRALLTTGFSGTNDSRPLLPYDVVQLDLQEQEHTNALVLHYLLQPANQVVLMSRASRNESDAEKLLATVLGQQPAVQVILDVGAQILEMTNVQLAAAWLKGHDVSKEAAVFVNDADDLCVIDRQGRVDLLQTSSFLSRLDVCLIFLDEAHTRGIDLKLPTHYRAAVTLGAGLTKDRLVQACMRMRQLGKGQTLVFCVSEEIRDKIVAMSTPTLRTHPSAHITIEDILAWAVSETHGEVRRCMPLWAVQGDRFVRHQRIWDTVSVEGQTSMTKHHAEAFMEKEALSIEDRYTPNVSEYRPGYLTARPGTDLARIAARCAEFEDLKYSASSLQEEQERELSPENESERQVQRAPPAKALEHNLHDDVRKFALTGVINKKSTAVLPAFSSLCDTSAAAAYPYRELDGKNSQFLVSKDFMRTVESSTFGFTTDTFQRSVQWILTNRHPSSNTVAKMLVISPFEANELYPLTKASKSSALHVYKPRTNSVFPALDNLDLYTVSGIFGDALVSRTLAVRLNVFAGQLYIGSYEDLLKICKFLGLCAVTLTQQMSDRGWKVDADSFILRDGEGVVGGESGLTQSPVHFVKALLSKIRRNGEGISKTPMGQLLEGKLFRATEFEA